MLLWFKDLINVTEKLHYTDPTFQHSCLVPSSGVVFICCNKRSFHILTNQLPFFWQGVNRCRVVSRHHHNLHKGRLHNHVWTFILIQMPPFFPIVSVCALFEFNNVIKQSGYFFLRPLSVFFFLFFSFLFFFLSQDLCGREMEMIRIGA